MPFFKSKKSLDKPLMIVSTKAAELLNKGRYYYYKAGTVEQAIECYDQAIKLDPVYAIAYAEKANCLRFQDKYDEALQNLDYAIALDKSCITALYIKVRISNSTR